MANKQGPFNIEAEKAVIGSMIASHSFCFEALSLLTENDFYDDKANAVIFRAIKNLDDKSRAIDNASVAAELQTNMKLLDQVGGVDYLHELSEYYLGDSHAKFHMNTIHDLALVRSLFTISHSLEKEFMTKEVSDIADFIEKYDNAITKITKNRSSGDFKDTSDVVSQVTKEIDKKRKETIKTDLIGISTGFKSLDHYTNGWQPGQLIILAARPSVGKTAFAINLIYNAAITSHKTVVFFSLEMRAESIVQRLLASVSLVDLSNIKIGKLEDEEWLAIQEAEGQINNTKILIDDTSGIKLGEIKTKVTKLKARDPNLGLIVIDYLGLIGVNREDVEAKEKAEEISRALKILSLDLNIPIVCLCQLSRANEKAKREPLLSDLRDSGTIEQDADIVMFLHRDNYQVTESNNSSQGNNTSPVTKVIVRKNRNGIIGTIELMFLMNYGKFMEVENNRSNN